MTMARAGFLRYVAPVPGVAWRGMLHKVARDLGRSFAKLPDVHRRVRELVVRELPGAGTAIPPEAIAEQLGLPRARVVAALDDLERWLTYLVRDAEGRVSWAFPVTVEETPHLVNLGAGIRIHAA